MSSAAPIVLVGAGLAAWSTVRELRKLQAEVPVVLITADSGDFYAKPSLSNAFAQKRTPEQLVSTSAAKMAETLNVQLMAHSRVTAVDPQARSVQVAQGEAVHTVAYSALVIATGAQPITVPLQGSAGASAMSVNSLDDFSKLFLALGGHGISAGSSENNSKTVLIMGAGLIGCEFANDLAVGGHRVHVVDPGVRPLAALVPESLGLALQATLAELGVRWHMGTTVQALNNSEAPGPCLTATLANGETVQADLVLSAVGLRADTRLAQAAGLVCERGIVVDAHLQTSAPAIYALGDCAQYASAGGRTLPYVMPIMQAAKALASTLAGTPTPVVFPLMPVAIKTPVLPLVVQPPPPEANGQWVRDDAQTAMTGEVWRFVNAVGAQCGFALSGKATARRLELIKTTGV
ncbi:FAD-dependent oxidoreductase [Rhodoferax aquaticus]|uniref:Pyridine nucleotide-disulfide oxidoreductase n=1 Tax=Rhodoferax aquaticus TaxID=2527691 RepID=A0A515ESS8_9BURK|nr:FAD-dependent oxidoreductase [Rhodoferax aquaticus]QDL55717.1 pyridine nucleotide-disulfide oxidoreductase [Rhodoferax aquaticus]